MHEYRPHTLPAWLIALACVAHLGCGDDGPSAPVPVEPALEPPRTAPPTAPLEHAAPASGPGSGAPAGAMNVAPPANGASGEGSSPASSESPRPRVAETASAFHLDEGGTAAWRPPVAPARGRTERASEGKAIHIKLLSTPSGALVAVDGVALGRTPAFWQGEFTGKPREFTFVLPGHAMARYRFVPTESGVVHGTLSKLEYVDDPAPAPGAPELPAPSDP